MNPDQLLTLAGILIVTGGAAYGATYAGRTSSKVAKETNAVTFSRDLMARLESLEEDVKSLRKDLNVVSRNFSTAINFIERMVFWAKGGSKPPIPGIPESLKAHLDPSLIDQHYEQQERDNA
jgi:DNA-binding transcriptional regulator YiaG